MKFVIALLLALFSAQVAEAQVITWSSDRATPATGTASGTASWSAGPITLKAGINNITIQADDGAGNVGSSSIAVTYAPTHPGSTLAGAWGFEENIGTGPADSSVNKNNGILFNGATQTANGKYGQGLLLNGSNQYVLVADQNSLDFSQSFTLTAWVNPSAANTDFRAILSKNSDESFNPPYRVFASVSGYCADGGVAGFVRSNGASGPEFYSCNSTPLPVGSWTFVALSYNNATQELKLYQSTAGATITTTTTIATGYMEASTGALLLGGSQFGEYFQGILDEIRVYNWALPLAGTLNTTFGTPCTTLASTEQNSTLGPSIIGAANCPVVPLAPPTTITFAVKTTIQFGATNSGVSFGNQP